MFDSKKTSTLNDLIATTLDSVDGYRTAAEQTNNGNFQKMFQARASERQMVATDLQTEVRRLGEEPEDDGTILASAHRVFLDLKTAVTGNDEQAIVSEVERGEDHIKAKYEDAIKDEEVDPQTKAIIQTAYGSIRTGHDQMRDLKNVLGQ